MSLPDRHTCLQVFSEHTELSLPQETQKYLLLLSGNYLASVDFEAMKVECNL
jgi:hypothetical protein